MTKSTITRERLQEIAEDGFLKHGESKELARMALAAMDREPQTDDELSNFLWYSQEATCHSDPNYYCEFQRLATPGFIASIIRELQERRKAEKDSEPVGEVIERPCSGEMNTGMTYRRVKGLGEMESMPVGTKFYVAQPAPVVPEEDIPCDLENEWCMVDEFNKKNHIPDEKVKGDDFEINGPLSCYQAGKIDGWNACRAAMLNGGKP